MGLASRVKNLLSAVDSRGWFRINEPHSGAWQKDDEWSVDSVLSYPPVYTAITLIASDIAKLRPTVKRLQDGIWQEAASHPYKKLLKKPNHFQDHIQFKEWWQTCKLSYGNAYGLLQRDVRGTPERVYILDPQRVTPLVSEFGDVFYQLATDRLSMIPGEQLTVPASEIIHDKINPIFHPLVGVSPLFAGGEVAQHGSRIIKDSSTFFANGASPGGLLTAPGAISDGTAERLSKDWNANYTGKNAGKIAVAGDGLKYEPIRMKSTDAQLSEQLRLTAEFVASVFHIPAYKIGAGPLPTHNNIEALTKDYYSQCLQRHIEGFELCFDMALGLTDDYRVELDLEGLFRMDAKTQLETIRAGVDGAILTPNEGRAKLSLKPLAGGDTVYMQQQNYSLEALAQRDALEPLQPDPAPQNPVQRAAKLMKGFHNAA